MDTKQPQVIDELVSFEEDHTDPVEGTQLVIKRQQDITESYLDSLKEQANAPVDRFGNRMARLCSIPTSIVQKWKREGFDIFDKNITAREIIRRLNKESMDSFITTRKSI